MAVSLRRSRSFLGVYKHSVAFHIPENLTSEGSAIIFVSEKIIFTRFMGTVKIARDVFWFPRRAIYYLYAQTLEQRIIVYSSVQMFRARSVLESSTSHRCALISTSSQVYVWNASFRQMLLSSAFQCRRQKRYLSSSFVRTASWKKLMPQLHFMFTRSESKRKIPRTVRN